MDNYKSIEENEPLASKLENEISGLLITSMIMRI